MRHQSNIFPSDYLINNNSALIDFEQSGFYCKKVMILDDKIKSKYEDCNQLLMSQSELQQSLNDMRNLLKLMQNFINGKLERTYKYIVQNIKQKQVIPYDPQKQVEILKACLFNAQKTLSIQKIELNQTAETLMDYNKRGEILDDLDQQIKDLKYKVYIMDKQTKQKQLEVDKYDLELVGNAIAAQHREVYQLFGKVKKRHEYHLNAFKQKQHHYENLQQSIQNLKYKSQEIEERYNQLTRIAEQKSLEVKENHKFIKLKHKYQQLQETKLVEQKKKQVFLRNQKNNEYILLKNINDLQKAIKQTDLRVNEAQKSINLINKNIESLVEFNPIYHDLANNVNKKYKDICQQQNISQPKLQITSAKNNFKPSLSIKKDKSILKDQPKQQIINTGQKQQYQFQQNNNHLGNSKKFRLKKLQRGQNNMEQHLNQSQVEIQPQNKSISKPLLKLKKDRKQLDNSVQKEVNRSMEELPNFKPSRFSRLGQKRITENKIPQDYMKVLQQKGRKILGL